jgi:cell division protein FtsB
MRRLLPALVLGFTVSSLLVFWLGDSGVASYRSLARYRAGLQANVGELGAANARLRSELAGLDAAARSPEVLAREIGLYREGERVVRIEGAPSQRPFMDVGRLVRRQRETGTRSALLKGAGLALALALSVLALIRARQTRQGSRGDHPRR